MLVPTRSVTTLNAKVIRTPIPESYVRNPMIVIAFIVKVAIPKELSDIQVAEYGVAVERGGK